MDTSYAEKPASMPDLISRLAAAPLRLAAAVEGLSVQECERVVVADEKTVRQVVEHVACVSIGWTGIFFDAIADNYNTPKKTDPNWHKSLEFEASRSMDAAKDVFCRHNGWLGEFLASLPESDFGRPFKIVSFLTEPFLIRESINWGCVLHCDWHLAQLHLKREILGKPLDWLATYVHRWPEAIRGHQAAR